MKKRNFVILTFFLVIFFVLCLTGCEAECIETKFNCDNDVGCAFFPSEQKGLKCSGKCIDCEWYPMFFGIGYYNCLSPVVCGFSLCDGAPLDSRASKPPIPNNATNLPLTYTTSEIKEKEDYVVQSITYTLEDAQGKKYIATSFDDLIHSNLYEEIRGDSLVGQLEALDKMWTFSITVEIAIQARQEMEVKAKVDLSTSVYDSIINRPNYTTYSKTAKLNKGTNTICIEIKDLEYINTRMNQSMSDITISGTKTVFALGGE